MLPRTNRLRRPWEFRRARGRGRSYPSTLLVLHVYRLPTPSRTTVAGSRIATDESAAGPLGRKSKLTSSAPAMSPVVETVARAGITVSKRVGKAVVRNRVKRRIREGLRANLMKVKPGYDLIITARPPAASASFGEIRLTIEDLLNRSGLLPGTKS